MAKARGLRARLGARHGPLLGPTCAFVRLRYFSVVR
jgi:hypothetical protein